MLLLECRYWLGPPPTHTQIRLVFNTELTSGDDPEDGLSVAAQVFVLGWLWWSSTQDT